MSIKDILRKLLAKLGLIEPEPVRPKISIIIPYGGRNKHRRRVLDWLIKYWSNALPDAEIIVGYSRSKPFIKTEAFNNAIRRARGQVLVLLDADAYMAGSTIERAANNIIEELDTGNRVWYIPYRRLYRLTEECTEAILESDPTDPVRMGDPPLDECVQGEPRVIFYGRRYAAMAIVIPREAFEALGLLDERFNGGWGGEDVSLMKALDTIWGKHKSINSAVFHLWHPTLGTTYLDKRWPGQKGNATHWKLASRYSRAARSPSKMKELVKEGAEASKKSASKRVIEAVIPPVKVHKR